LFKFISGKSLFVRTDITKSQEIDGLVEKTLTEYGTVDILANNAGVAVLKPIEECSLEEWDRVHNVDLRGLWYLTRAVVKTMKEKRYGKIINIGSTTGVVSFQNQFVYAAAKGGVVNLARELGCELAPYNIDANAICPGIIETPIYGIIGVSMKVKENAAGFLKEIPLNG